MPQPTYTEKAMADRVIRGDVGEALFRLLAEKRLSLTDSRLEQWGFNPVGVVDPSIRGTDPATWSGPDFALVEADAPEKITEAKPLVGISINTQAAPYNVRSSREGGCLGCPDLEQCLDFTSVRTWFNLLNVENDYQRFHSTYGVDVAMVTLYFEWRTNAVNWLKTQDRRTNGIKAYIVGGEQAAEQDPDAAEVRKYLEFGGRAGANRDYALTWAWWSDLASGAIPFYATYGFAQTARPPMKLCLQRDRLRSEEELWEALSEIDQTGARTVSPPDLTPVTAQHRRLDGLRVVPSLGEVVPLHSIS